MLSKVWWSRIYFKGFQLVHIKYFDDRHLNIFGLFSYFCKLDFLFLYSYSMDRDEASITTSDEKSHEEEAPVAAGLEPTPPISFWQLFRYSTYLELFWLFIGFVMCCIKALTLPAVVIVYSEFTAMLVDRAMQVGTSSTVHALPLLGGGKKL